MTRRAFITGIIRMVFTVREMCRIAFKHVRHSMDEHLVIDHVLFRPAKVDFLLGNSDKARQRLGWKPTVSPKKINEMLNADLARLSR